MGWLRVGLLKNESMSIRDFFDAARVNLRRKLGFGDWGDLRLCALATGIGANNHREHKS
jgi:hypothetical protein